VERKRLGKLVNLTKEKEEGASHSWVCWRLHLGPGDMKELVREAISKGYIRVLLQRTSSKPRRVYKWTGKELEGEDIQPDVGEFIDVTADYLAKLK